MYQYQREYIKTIEVHVPLTCEVNKPTATLETAIRDIGWFQQNLNLFAAFRVVGSCTDSRGIKELVVNFLVYGRRDFANALYLINWAVSRNYEVFVQTHKKRASLKQAPGDFWRLLALSQMWYRKEKYDDEEM